MEKSQSSKSRARKTKDVYVLIWNREEIDQADSFSDARYLQKEYNLAYGGGVSIKKRREAI